MKRHVRLATDNGHKVSRAVRKGRPRPIIICYYRKQGEDRWFKRGFATTEDNAKIGAVRKLLKTDARVAVVHDEHGNPLFHVTRRYKTVTIVPV